LSSTPGPKLAARSFGERDLALDNSLGKIRPRVAELAEPDGLVGDFAFGEPGFVIGLVQTHTSSKHSFSQWPRIAEDSASLRKRAGGKAFN
jgi:hypothetical protein